MACFQKAYSRSVLFIQSNMQEDEKKHLDTPQTIFTGQTLDRTTLCPMGSRRSGHRLTPTAVHALCRQGEDL